ncbi:LysR family transcriptional regulator [Pseudazoarcus pumilus]|uniref:LysR family transcriptional regulator n=2 Tax=Pseudazoarcus pumilus TaxID=2067960 RepID=A0A2I6SB18_9RHOO|nr:LysR family transcriptional regulator [Pseudazoarcus pumilus]
MVDETETFGGALEDVRAFCAVVEFGTVSAAARLLGETKGSVSRRVSRLERRLGVALLARTPRAVSPTEEGTAFFERARESLRLLDDAMEAAHASRAEPRGHLRVTAPVDFGMDVLPPLLVRFRALHPGITVELLLDDASLDLAANRIDLALRATPGELPDMGYRASVLVAFSIDLYAAPDYLADRAAPMLPADLAAHALIASSAGGAALHFELRDGKGRRETVTARAPVRCSDFASALRLAVAGGGIARIPAPVAAQAVNAGQLLRILPDWRVADARLFAISLAGRDAPARVRVFRDFLRDELAANASSI